MPPPALLIRGLPLVFLWELCWALYGFQGTQQGLCQNSVTVPKTRVVSEQVYQTYSYTKRCGFLRLKKCRVTDGNWVVHTRMEWFEDVELEAVCCAGYTREGDECKPTCDPGCENGYCAGDNQCTCNPGYAYRTSTSCDPVCSPQCSHGTCIKPNICACDSGYRKDLSDSHYCHPVCSQNCVRSACTAPETCSCYSGYHKDPMDNYTCNPTCSELCINAICEAPETCKCYSGYAKDSIDSYVCNPVCSQECQHGICISPETCRCDPDYQIDHLNKYVCNPVCSQGCQNGNCVAPETCSCLTGYKKDSLNASICNPICVHSCINALCTAPNSCTCLTGYIPNVNESNVCDPYCSNPCKNGFCSAPEECTCHGGFQKNVNKPYQCDPVCSKECVNSVCSNPETCSCFEGYQIDSFDKYTCEPVCSKECKNSKCRAPEICICDEGYVYDKNDRYTCIPHCPDGCVYSNCTEPNTCECFEGYEKLEDQQNICKPVCSSCENADCVAPQVCECWSGYEVFTPSYCVPICTSCQYGQCVLPESCSCWEGYENPLDGNETCVPVCVEECINSECSAPDKCSCWDGFVNITGDWTSCSPHCSKQCVNGICVNPEECECLPGYELDEYDSYSCHPFCSEGCTNGLCVAPEICSCLWGFESSQNTSICSNSSSSIQECSFSWDFVLIEDAEESCFEVPVDERNHFSHLIECPFLKLMFFKYFTEIKNNKELSFAFQLNCSVNSTIIADRDVAVLCETENIGFRSSETISTTFVYESLSTESKIPDYFLSTELFDELSSELTPSTMSSTEESPNEQSTSKLFTLKDFYFDATDPIYFTESEQYSYQMLESINLYRSYGEYTEDNLPTHDYSDLQVSVEGTDYPSSVSDSVSASTGTESSLTSVYEYEESSATDMQSSSTAYTTVYKRTNFTVKIILDNIPYIRKSDILTDYFNNISDVHIPDDVCVCLKISNGSCCGGDFRVNLVPCSCDDRQNDTSWKISEARSAESEVMPILMLFILILKALVIGIWYAFRKSTQPTDYLINELEKKLAGRQAYVNSTHNTFLQEDYETDL